ASADHGEDLGPRAVQALARVGLDDECGLARPAGVRLDAEAGTDLIARRGGGPAVVGGRGLGGGGNRPGGECETQQGDGGAACGGCALWLAAQEHERVLTVQRGPRRGSHAWNILTGSSRPALAPVRPEGALLVSVALGPPAEGGRGLSERSGPVHVDHAEG